MICLKFEGSLTRVIEYINQNYTSTYFKLYNDGGNMFKTFFNIVVYYYSIVFLILTFC